MQADLLDRVRKLLAKAEDEGCPAAEEAAVASAPAADAGAGGPSAALVLADRSLVVRRQVASAYPRLRKTRVTYSGGGYGDGYREGQKADIGSTKLRSRSAGALGR